MRAAVANIEASALSPLEQLGLVSGWAPKRLVAVLVMWNYLDESGEFNEAASPKQLTRLTLGGFFAPWESVKALCRDWRKALDEECLAEFHMREIASDEHLFDSWPEERQNRLNRFVDILCEHAQIFCAYSYAVINPDRAFEDAYETALNRVLIRAATISDERNVRANVVFAHTEEISGELIGRYFDRLKWGEYLRGYSVLRSRDNPTLQAAEIVARGMKRFMQDGGITHSFARLVATKKPIEVWPMNPIAAIRARGILPNPLGGAL